MHNHIYKLVKHPEANEETNFIYKSTTLLSDVAYILGNDQLYISIQHNDNEAVTIEDNNSKDGSIQINILCTKLSTPIAHNNRSILSIGPYNRQSLSIKIENELSEIIRSGTVAPVMTLDDLNDAINIKLLNQLLNTENFELNMPLDGLDHELSVELLSEESAEFINRAIEDIHAANFLGLTKSLKIRKTAHWPDIEITYCLIGKKYNGQNQAHFPNFKGSDDQVNMFRQALDTWEKTGMNRKFRECKSLNSHLRIGFSKDSNTESDLGTSTTLSHIKPYTMNFGKNFTPDHCGYNLALHEIGHALGRPHEHLHPCRGFDYDIPKTEKFFCKKKSWKHGKTHSQVIRPLFINDFASMAYDPDSIMHYYLPSELLKWHDTTKTKGIYPRSGLSKGDIKWACKTYP